MDFGFRSFVLIKCKFNKEFNKGQDRGSEILDFRFLSFALLDFNKEFNKGQDRGLEILDFRFLSFVLIRFHKELNKGKKPDSKIQKSKKSKNYRGAPKVLDFWIYTVFFGVVWIFHKKKKKKKQCLFLDVRGFLVLENLENPKNKMIFFGFFRFLLKNPQKTQ